MLGELDHFLCQLGECSGGFPDVPVDLGLKGEPVRYCSTHVHKLVDSFQLVVCDADGCSTS